MTSEDHVDIDVNKIINEINSLYNKSGDNGQYINNIMSQLNNIIMTLTNIKTIGEKYKASDLDCTKNYRGMEYGAICAMIRGCGMISTEFSKYIGKLSVIIDAAHKMIEERDKEKVQRGEVDDTKFTDVMDSESLYDVINSISNNLDDIIRAIMVQSDLFQVSMYLKNNLCEFLPSIPLGSNFCMIDDGKKMSIVPIKEFSSRENFHKFSGFSIYIKSGDDYVQIPFGAVAHNMHMLAERVDNGIAMPFIIHQDISCLITSVWHFVYIVMTLKGDLDSSFTDESMSVPRFTLSQFKTKYKVPQSNYSGSIVATIQDPVYERVNMKEIVATLLASIHKASHLYYEELCTSSSSTDVIMDNFKQVADKVGISQKLENYKDIPLVNYLMNTATTNSDAIKSIYNNGFDVKTIGTIANIMMKGVDSGALKLK